MPPVYTFTTIEPPPGYAISAAGINDYGQVTGMLTDASGGTIGYLYVEGTFFTFAAPADAASFTITGLNNLERPSGVLVRRDGTLVLFQYDGRRFIEQPDNLAGTLFALGGENDFGEMVGSNSLRSGQTTTLVSWISNQGGLQPFSLPGVTAVLPTAINDKGQVIGTYTDAHGVSYGFLETAGAVTTVGSDLLFSPVPTAISNTGEIVGFDEYALPDGIAGFVNIAGVTRFLFAPNANVTMPSGVNDFGQIVGNYRYFQNGGVFLATPQN